MRGSCGNDIININVVIILLCESGIPGMLGEMGVLGGAGLV